MAWPWALGPRKDTKEPRKDLKTLIKDKQSRKYIKRKDRSKAATSQGQTTKSQEKTPNSQAGSRLDASWIQAGYRLDLRPKCVQMGQLGV